MNWKNTKVRNADGRSGTIVLDAPGFMHRSLFIKCDDGSEGHVQLNADGADSGDRGWEWLPPLANEQKADSWLMLGDHNKEQLIARERP